MMCILSLTDTKLVQFKEHGRVRRSKGHAAPNHQLTLTTVLPARDIIMKNALNKQQLAHLLCMCPVPPSVHMFGEVDNIFYHEEADVSMVSYTNKQKKVKRKYRSSQMTLMFLCC